MVKTIMPTIQVHSIYPRTPGLQENKKRTKMCTYYPLIIPYFFQCEKKKRMGGASHIYTLTK